MKIFDCHCDTLVQMYHSNLGFCDNGLDWDLSLINHEDEAYVTYAIFNDCTLGKNDILNIIGYFKSRSAYQRNFNGILSIEALGNQPDFDLQDISEYYSLGIKMMSLTWNNDNILCGGIGNNSDGLTDLGKTAVSVMKENKIVLDVSHISDKGFWDVCSEYDGVIVASHSNSRSVCKNPRNLTDDQFREIVRRGGCAGINFNPLFLSDSDACIEDILRHVEKFAELGGRYNIGIGSDFDGIDQKVRNLENCKGFYKLYETFLAKNYSELFINDLFFNNFGRILDNFEI